MDERNDKPETIRPLAADQEEEVVRPRSNAPLLLGLAGAIAVFAGLLIWTFSVKMPMWRPSQNYTALATPAPSGVKQTAFGPEVQPEYAQGQRGGPGAGAAAAPIASSATASPPSASEAAPPPATAVDDPVIHAMIRDATVRGLRDCGAREYPDAFLVAVTFWADGTVKDAVILDPEFAKTEAGSCIAHAVAKLEIQPYGGEPTRSFLEEVHPDAPMTSY